MQQRRDSLEPFRLLTLAHSHAARDDTPTTSFVISKATATAVATEGHVALGLLLNAGHRPPDEKSLL